MSERIYLGEAGGCFTLADERRGYSETRRYLAGYDDDKLKRAYLDALRDGFGALFGHHARRFGNLVVDELTARGITEIPNIFGAIQIARFRR